MYAFLGFFCSYHSCNAYTSETGPVLLTLWLIVGRRAGETSHHSLCVKMADTALTAYAESAAAL
jgi:hypothetical protein